MGIIGICLLIFLPNPLSINSERIQNVIVGSYDMFHLSTRTSDQLWVSTVTLSKGVRTHEEEDKISSHFLLKVVADACKVSATFVSELNDSETPDECERLFTEEEELQQLINREIYMKVYPFSNATSDSNPERKIILSGSFNPLHNGHLKLWTLPQGKTDIISNQPYFYKKAELFPGCAFVIGADTASRLINLQPKYYGGYYNKMLEILLGCKRTGCSFLVGGQNVHGVFKVLEDLEIPIELKDMFVSIPEERFRMDISSTELS